MSRSPLFDLPDEVHYRIVGGLDLRAAVSMLGVSKGASDMVKRHAPPPLAFVIANGADTPQRAGDSCRLDVFEFIHDRGLCARLPGTQSSITNLLFHTSDPAKSSAAFATARYILETWSHVGIPIVLLLSAYHADRRDMLHYAVASAAAERGGPHGRLRSTLRIVMKRISEPDMPVRAGRAEWLAALERACGLRSGGGNP